jgi:outer membrane protein OmpA-like peptidoglycan-associated protein
MDLAPATRDVIKKDSLAYIKSEGLVGDKFVEVSFGSEQSPRVNNGDTIQSAPPIDISDLIKKTDVILDSTKDAMENIQGTASNLNAMSSKINRGTGTIGALINDKEVYRNVNEGAAAFHEDMEAMKHNFLLRGFFNKRGYEDSAELKTHEIPKLPATPVAKQFDYDAKKLFDKPNTAKLKDDKALNEAGNYLQGNPFGLAVVAAYTDEKGDTDMDRALTEARAMVVRDYLVQNFKLDDTRIKTIGLGKSAQANSSKVEVLIYPAGTNAAQLHKPEPRHN